MLMTLQVCASFLQHFCVIAAFILFYCTCADGFSNCLPAVQVNVEQRGTP